MDMAHPETFTRDPERAWGFYGHRLNLYRRHPPHAEFAILRRWAASMPLGAFIMTRNVDGHFQQPARYRLPGPRRSVAGRGA